MDKDLQEVIENSEDKKKKEEDVNKAFFVENISVNNIEAQGNSNAGSEERNQNEPWIKIEAESQPEANLEKCADGVWRHTEDSPFSPL